MAHLRDAPSYPERGLDADPPVGDAPGALQAFSPEYWLSHCDGFRVDSSRGRVGIVEEVVLDADGRPLALRVLGGHAGQTRWLLSVEDIAVVQPGRERVALVDPLPAALALEPRA